MHRDSCRAAGEKVAERKVDDTVDALKLAEEALEVTRRSRVLSVKRHFLTIQATDGSYRSNSFGDVL